MSSPFKFIQDLLKEIEEETRKLEKAFDNAIREMQNFTADMKQPYYDVVEDENEVKIFVELPGVNKDQINIRISGNRVMIRAQSDERKYYGVISLPEDVDEKSAKAIYKNGLLTITLRKKSSSEGTEVKVE